MQQWFYMNVDQSTAKLTHSNRACHSCRELHKRCNGERPCSNCIKRKRECLDYNKALHRQKLEKISSTKVQNQPTTSSGIHNNHRSSPNSGTTAELELQRVKEELARVQEQLQVARKLNERYVEEYQQQQQKLEQLALQLETQRTSPISKGLSIDLWNPPLDLQKPLVIVDTTTLKLVGCNQFFRDLTGMSAEKLQNQPTSFDLLPEKAKGPTLLISQWNLKSGVKHIMFQTVLYFHDQELFVKTTARVERSYIWVEVDLVDEISDEFYIDNIHVPATYRIRYNPNQRVQIPTHPEVSFKRLLAALWQVKYKYVYSDQKEEQERTLQMLSMLCEGMLNSNQAVNMPSSLMNMGRGTQFKLQLDSNAVNDIMNQYNNRNANL